MRDDRLITQRGFLDAFLRQHQDRPDRPFCFILGAGASRPSGIPAGAELARQWLEEMHRAEDFETLPLEEWATSARLKIANFDIHKPALFYPELYLRRFQGREEEGYAFLEAQMDGKEPSFGYAVLAYLLSEQRHKIVITTNFDNLIADALSIHSSTFPLVVGHDSLASYARVELRRPLIAKVHGGLGFKPKSAPEDLGKLPDAWQKALSRIFERYTPIVIGYDGNDGSLMSFLEKLPLGTPDTAYWCFRDVDGRPQQRIEDVPQRARQLVQHMNGALVPIQGFDELMAVLLTHLQGPLRVPDLLDRLKEKTRRRENNYLDQQRRLFELASGRSSSAEPQRPEPTAQQESPPSGELQVDFLRAVQALAGQMRTKPWWLWVQEAKAAADPDRGEAIYEEAIAAIPNNASLLGNYATFLCVERRDLDRAEEFYRRAIEADPKHATHLGNYATFLRVERRDLDRAEEFYGRAIEADPKHATHLGNYAQHLFLRGKDAEANRMLAAAEGAVRSAEQDLQSELCFYRLAHIPGDWPHGLSRMKDLLVGGARSRGWDLSENVRRAREAGHPNPELLEAIARVISGDAPLTDLDAFPEWRDAPGSSSQV